MSIASAISLFAACLVLSLISSMVLATDLDRIGARLGLSEGLVGLLTALGANAPEISSAVAAMLAHNHDVGVGVVVGSNLFNLAALLGLSAVVAGSVKISKRGLLLNGTVAIAATAILAAVVLGWIGPGLALILLVFVLTPYLLVMSLRPRQLKRLLPSGAIEGFLEDALERATRDARTGETPRQAAWADIMAVIPSLVSIVVASVGMVDASLSLGKRFHLSDVIVGTLILAALTSLPNLFAAVRLALHGRGSAVVSESLNSNTLNVLCGIVIPVLILGREPLSPLNYLAVWWLLGLTFLTLALTYIGGGLRRWEGMAVIAAYVAFVLVVLART